MGDRNRKCCLTQHHGKIASALPVADILTSGKEGKGAVTDVSLLTGGVKERLDKSPDSPPVSFRREEVKVIRDNRIKVAKDEQEKLRAK